MRSTGILLISILLSLAGRSQMVDSMINVYAEQLPFEKLHLHFDKEVYRSGETIWFKAYAYTGFSPSAIGKNLYAELINSDGSILQRKIYPILESASAGNFDLPDSLTSGNYLVRAYTAWMLNFDTAFVFQKNIKVLNKKGETAIEKTPPPAKNFSIQFLAEGGNLVNNLESVVAFKAIDINGLPVNIGGQVINSKGDKIVSFSSAHNGMGTFLLTPLAGETYRALCKDPQGNEQTIDLPVAKEEGIVLKITPHRSNVLFQISRSEGAPADWRKLIIVALLDQARVYKAKANLENTTVTSGSIPVGELPSGILQITVFSDNWEPVAERIILVNNNNFSFDATINMPVLNTAFRAKNTIEIQVDDTLLTNMSLSVTDAAVGKISFADNIISRLLLTGDIKGYVHQPAYYFSNASDSTAAHLDLVMRTHGWRRYNWGAMSRGKKPVLKYPIEQPLMIEAKAFGVTPISPLRPDEQIFAIVQNRDSSKQFLELNKSGADKFYSPGVFIYDTVTLYYQFMKDKKAEKDLSFAFGNNFAKGVRKVNSVFYNPLVQLDSILLSREKFFAEKNSQFNYGNILEAVIVKSKTKQKSRADELNEKYTSGLFRSSDAYTFDFTGDNNMPFQDVFTYLQGRVAGLQITGNGQNARLSWRGSAPLLYINELPSDVQMLSTVNPNDIAFIKVLRPPFMGGIGGGAGGAIAVYTKRGNERQPDPSMMGLSKTKVIGYSTAREFYIPDYQDLSFSSEIPYDYRTTLYWNPFVLTDNTKQKVRFNFYNNDISKAFRIVLEGINEIGKLVRIEKVVQPTK